VVCGFDGVSAEAGEGVPCFPVVGLGVELEFGEWLAELVAEGHGGEVGPGFSLFASQLGLDGRISEGTYVFGHVCEPSDPVLGVIIGIAPPGVAVEGVIAPPAGWQW